ncbi:hypothetical protein GCM10027445_47330 [Amycolatopsis endophytica]|uniref:Anti-sigma-D factor RsdA sigma factor binding region domain-containing protein n=1 Tax=Amycolatopsis endophytica TaxID=860233 RepID=A0A853AYF0_9PSEU|nr:anti-sigma-D factor RsdA [Amycolatopsis endophytica]NYI87720.1 hypothetical protein [Amycolatopsis endophytica]
MTDREDVRQELDELEFDPTMSSSQAEFEADLTAIRADDGLLDSLGGSDPGIADDLGDQELNALLLSWRRDIDSEPLAELIDTDTAVTTIKTAALARRHGQRAHRRRLLVPVAAAAAVLAIAFTGTSIAARDAQPGDTLWGLTKVLYADHARSVEAASAARIDLQQASIALSQGRIAEAQQALAEAAAKLSQVTEEENLSQLMAEHQQLASMLPGSTTRPPDSSTSLPTSAAPPQTSSTRLPITTTTTPQPTTTTPTPPSSSSSTTPTPTTESSTTQPPGDGTSGSTIRYDNPDAGTGQQPAGVGSNTGTSGN